MSNVQTFVEKQNHKFLSISAALAIPRCRNNTTWSLHFKKALNHSLLFLPRSDSPVFFFFITPWTSWTPYFPHSDGLLLFHIKSLFGGLTAGFELDFAHEGWRPFLINLLIVIIIIMMIITIVKVRHIL